MTQSRRDQTTSAVLLCQKFVSCTFCLVHDLLNGNVITICMMHSDWSADVMMRKIKFGSGTFVPLKSRV